MKLVYALAVCLSWLQLAQADQRLDAMSLVPCMNSDGLTSTKFNFTFDRKSGTIDYDVSVNVAFSGYVFADIELWIYGLKAVTTRLDPCSSGSALKQLCPVNTGKIEIQGSETLSRSIIKEIPGIAFQVPDLDAYAIAKVRSRNSTEALMACVRIELSNTKTVEQTAVKWVTACLSGLGLLISGVLVQFGSSVTAQHIGAASMLLFNYFQSMVLLDMEAVERVPPIASGWAENIAWSVGLIYTSFMQKIFRWYVQATGGDPATYKIYHTKPVLPQRLVKRATQAAGSVIPPRVADYMSWTAQQVVDGVGKLSGSQYSSLSKRYNTAAQEAYAQSTNLLVVYRGIKRAAWKMGIEETSAVLTTFTIFVFICVCVAVLFLIISGIMFIVIRGGTPSANASRMKQRSFANARYLFPVMSQILKGTLLRLLYVAFPSIMVFSMWEWIQRDSAGVIVTSVVMFVLTLVVILFNLVRMFLIGKQSQREMGTPEYLLYGDERVLNKYGFLYSHFNSKYYYFSAVFVVYNFVKACFIAFAQSSGQTQALAIFIIELAMLVLICYYKPFLSRAINIITIVTQVIMTLNAMFFLFFSNLMTQPLIVNGVMGVIFFILNAAFTCVLLIYTAVYGLVCFIGRSSTRANKDHQVTDDRLSFIEEKVDFYPDRANELTALGEAARADHDPSAAPEESHKWFDRDESDPRNPFEPQVPGATIRKSVTSSSGDRTRTMSSTAESSMNTPAFNNLYTGNGHRSADSRTEFVDQHYQSDSAEALVNSNHKDYGSKKWYKF